MVKKRAKLSGQGKALFFSEGEPPKTGEEKKPAPSPKKVKKEPSKSIAPKDFIQKINALKDMILQFKQLVDSEEFKKLRAKDLKKYKT
ncbi:MAG: hypothetical protein Kow0042_16800 [Calditrichia bacterium]